MDSEHCIRQSRRIEQKARFLCSCDATEQPFAVTMLNYNNEGVYFVSPRAFDEGDVILLYSRGGEFPETVSKSRTEEYETMAYARVRWCRALGGTHGTGFGIGAEYVVV